MEKIWEIAQQKFDDPIDQILFNRGIIRSVEDPKKEAFLRPDFERDLHDPFLMKGMKTAVARLKKARTNHEKIGIFADYDADGIPGAALLYRGLKKSGFQSYVYIPNREGGYGLSEEGINFLISKGCTLIVTVDLGIRNFKEATYCKEQKIDLIITDHHIPDDELPDALAVVNPKQKADKYPYKELSGCAVAFKLLQGLATEFSELDEKFLKWNLDLVGLSTISDVVPLTGENRTFAKYGILVNKKTKNLGLQSLIKIINIPTEKIDAYTLGFQIGPRINAPGRMDHATKSFELLVTEDKEEAESLAGWLDEKNLSRQKAMDEVIVEVAEMIDTNGLANNKIIIAAGDWQKGVIGPSASKLVEKYNKPTILFSASDDMYTGSARSVSGINILDLLEASSDYLEKFGGHKAAAGLTVKKSNFATFEKKIISLSNKIDENLLRKKINIDCRTALKDLTLGLHDQIAKLEPFGMGNPKPIFMVQDVRFENFRFVGRGEKHLSAHISDGNKSYKSIFFSFPYDRKILERGIFDVAFHLSADEWGGDRKLSLNIVDLRPVGV